MLNLRSLDYYCKLAERKLGVEIEDASKIDIHFGALTLYAVDFADESGWLDDNPYTIFDRESFAEDLLCDNEVVQLEGQVDNIWDENGVWITNPETLRECKELF